MDLPAGLLPNDLNIEIFADPDRFGKCLFTRFGQTKLFHELPLDIIPSLYNECYSDEKAVKALRKMGVKEVDLVEHYNFCNRGRYDSIPDIHASGKLTKEFFNCGRRGKCPGENIVCKPIVIEGSKITYREIECLSYLGQSLKDKQIKNEMGFRSITAVNSMMLRLRNKMNCADRTALALKAQQLGITNN